MPKHIGYRAALAKASEASYPEAVGMRVPRGGGDVSYAKSQALDSAATAFLRNRRNRRNETPAKVDKRSDDRAEARQYRSEGRPDLRPYRTLYNAEGAIRPGATLHGSGPSTTL